MPTFIGNDAVDDVVQNGTDTHFYGLGGNDDLSSFLDGIVVFYGGEGNDYLWANWPVGQTYGDFYGGNGNDRIEGGATLLSDYIFSGRGDDYVLQNPDGPGSDDYIQGGRGRDGLYAGPGDDEVYGGGGDDSGGQAAAGPNGTLFLPGLFGGSGNDLLDGGRGNDLLNGGPGKDELIGGKDSDTFQFSADLKKANVDKILDFKPNKDTIALEQGVFTGIGGSLSKKEFEIGKEADDNKDRIIYDKKKGKLFHDSDGKGGDDQDLFAKLDKKLKLDHKDFDMVLIV